MHIYSTYYQSLCMRIMYPPRSSTVCALFSQLYPSAQAAKEEIKLPPPLHLAHRDPNGLRGNIRLLNSTTRSPAVTVFCCFCRLLQAHNAAETPDCFALTMCPSMLHVRQVRMTFIVPIKLL